ncbi:MFS general substrate transporter [Melanomma pulvis-pyrius CBS 109.77]|uniref:MFS general substrate transporter n=1 Tax=Melanomma pulvis-pyrius CBS 109.77 TaxID=1314802 RepID=A0A6A6WXY3_9PLEO|nr:MFS general substrate transporter [Melanomma pulvis-pyrius CBS 109.77]
MLWPVALGICIDLLPDYGNPQGFLKGIISAVYSLDAILSLPFIPYVNDKLGRRGSIFGGSLVIILGQYSGSFGQVTAVGITFGTNNIHNNWGWRIPSFLQMAPSVLQIIFIYTLPESPRWLISHDREEEAEVILVKYHAEGNTESEFVKAEVLHLFSTAAMRRHLLITTMLGLFTQWSGNTLISYYFGDLLGMAGITKSVTKQKLNLANSCWSLVNGFIISIVVTRFRRRTLYLTCTCALLCCYTAWYISIHHNQFASIANVFFIFTYSPCYNIGYNALTYTYMVELWPFMERSRRISVFRLFSRPAGFFTTFVNPIGLKNIGWKWLIAYCCWLFFEITFVYFIFPETSNRTLEELAFLFEDKEFADRATKAVEKAVHSGHNENVDGKRYSSQISERQG